MFDNDQQPKFSVQAVQNVCDTFNRLGGMKALNSLPHPVKSTEHQLLQDAYDSIVSVHDLACSVEDLATLETIENEIEDFNY